MNLQHLTYFVELARNPHMPTVADKLRISQSTLSYSLNKLEDELGVPLFEKKGRNIRLTVYGEVFYKYVTQGIEALETGKNKVIDLSLGKNGKLGLGSSYIVDASFITDIIASFRKDFPKDKINYLIERGSTQSLMEAIDKNEIQIALLTLTMDKSKYHNYDFTPIFKRHFVAAVPFDHPLANKKSISLKDLAAFPIITFSELSGIRQRLDTLWKKNRLQPYYQAEVDDVRTILSLVKNGEGIALVPKSRYHIEPNLSYLDLEEDTHYTIYVVNKKAAVIPKKTQTIKEYIQEYCQLHELDETD